MTKLIHETDQGRPPHRRFVEQLLGRQRPREHGPPNQQNGSADPAGLSRTDLILDALPAAIYATDAAGRITYYNEAAALLWGCRPELGKTEYCGAWKLFWPDGTLLPHDECPMAVALRERRSIRGLEAVAERPDGSRVPVMPFPTPLFDDAGVLIGAVNMVMDLTETKKTAMRLASIVESSDDAIYGIDLDGLITSWNRGAAKLFGYSAAEIIGRPVTALMPTDLLDKGGNILERIARGEHVEHYDTIRRRKDGSLVDVSLTVSPMRNADGDLIGASKSARDVTERKRAEEQQALLLGEMKHRIKNSLSTVQAIASQTLHSLPPQELSHFIARLHALGAAHDLLTTRTWNNAPLGQVVNLALKPFKDMHSERLIIEGPEVSVSAQQSELLALAFHELATNAVKYGALSNGTGQVRVHWELETESSPRAIRLHWCESGGPAVSPPARKGFGSRLIEQVMDRQAAGGAQLEFAPQGLVCSIELPHDGP